MKAVVAQLAHLGIGGYRPEAVAALLVHFGIERFRLHLETGQLA